jgi:hypothetical protein
MGHKEDQVAYDLQADAENRVNDTTLISPLDDYNLPQAPPDSTGEPPPKAMWVVDAAQLSANWPQVGPVDGLWSYAGDGGASGVIGYGSRDGSGTGVFGEGGGFGSTGTGVLGRGKNGVIGLTGEPDGIPVLGQGSAATAVVGWAASPPQPTPTDSSGPGVTPLTMPRDVVTGVYGTVGDALSPSRNSARAGVWGDARNGRGDSADSGILGTSQSGPGVAGGSGSGPGVSGLSSSGPGVSGSSGSGPGVSGFSDNAEAGVFESANAAQLRLVPSAVPIEETPLMQTGQVGDLYLFSVAQDVGTSGTYDFNTILWLCVSPGWQHISGQAVWAPIQLGETIGG